MSIGKKIKAPPGLYLKLRKIQSEAEQIEKDASINMGNGRSFKGASIEAVLDVYLPIFEKYNMALIPNGQAPVIPPPGQPFNPHDFLMDFKYVLVDIETGDTHEFNIHANCVDGGDKAAGKGMTYALKYGYLQLCSGRRGEDPDTTEAQSVQKKEQSKPASKSSPQEKKETKGESELSVACMTIKQHFDIKEIAETMDVPKWPAVKAFTAGITKDYKDAAVKAQVNDFAAYWWTCCKVAGCKDVADAEAVYTKGKGKMTKSQREFIESMIDKRKEAKAASSSVEREPGEDG